MRTGHVFSGTEVLRGGPAPLTLVPLGVSPPSYRDFSMRPERDLTRT